MNAARTMAQVSKRSEECGAGARSVSYQRGDPLTGEQESLDEIIEDACKGNQLGREAPTSQVGYGGCDKANHDSPDLKVEGGAQEHDICGRDLYSKDRQEIVSGRSSESSMEGLPRPTRADGEVYRGESQFSGPKHELDVGSERREDAEVRGGVLHGATAGNAGQNGGGGGSKDSAEAYRYHQTGAPLPDHRNSPYSQQFTESDGPPGGGDCGFQEDEFLKGNTEGGTPTDAHGMHEKKGVTAKLKKMLSPHKHEDAAANAGDNLVGAPSEDNQRSPGLVTKLKNKVMPGHHKDEIDPTIYS